MPIYTWDQKEIKIIYESFNSIDDCSADDQALLLASKAALNDSYSPYSNFKVGSAVLLNDGNIVKGSNQENVAYPMCVCAERVAMHNAWHQHPKVPFLKIGVTTFSNEKNDSPPAPPCGACRQVIFEYEERFEKQIEILLLSQSGKILKFRSARDLLPLAFGKDFLI